MPCGQPYRRHRIQSCDSPVRMFRIIGNPDAASIKNRTIYESASEFTPIAPIFLSDAGIQLVFLSGNGIVYTSPTTDEWYRVGPTPVNITLRENNEAEIRPFYLPLDPEFPLACAKRFRFCNAAIHGEGGCGPFASFRYALAGAAPLFNTTYSEITAQTATTETGSLLDYFARIYGSSWFDLANILNHLGPRALSSQRGLMNGQLAGLASNQWQLDAMHLWAISMSSLQGGFVQTAYYPVGPSDLDLRTNYTGTNMDKLCRIQVPFPSPLGYVPTDPCLENKKCVARIVQPFRPLFHIKYGYCPHSSVVPPRACIVDVI
jgi:hypothetical protein